MHVRRMCRRQAKRRWRQREPKPVHQDDCGTVGDERRRVAPERFQRRIHGRLQMRWRYTSCRRAGLDRCVACRKDNFPEVGNRDRRCRACGVGPRSHSLRRGRSQNGDGPRQRTTISHSFWASVDKVQNLDETSRCECTFSYSCAARWHLGEQHAVRNPVAIARGIAPIAIISPAPNR